MSNGAEHFVFPLAREWFLTKQLGWLSEAFRIVLLTEDFELDPLMVWYSDIPANTIIERSGNLIGKTATDGYAYSQPWLFEELLDNQERVVNQIIVYKQEPAAEDRLLVAYQDSGFGIPFVPLGRNYWVGHNGLGWFRV